MFSTSFSHVTLANLPVRHNPMLGKRHDNARKRSAKIMLKRGDFMRWVQGAQATPNRPAAFQRHPAQVAQKVSIVRT